MDIPPIVLIPVLVYTVLVFCALLSVFTINSNVKMVVRLLEANSEAQNHIIRQLNQLRKERVRTERDQEPR